MGFKGYISIAKNQPQIKINDFERSIFQWLQEGPQSAYSVQKRLENEKKVIQAYKNVNKKIRRLHRLKLIEQVKGSFAHGAINYRLSDVGWFFVINNGLFNSKVYFKHNELSENNKDNPFFMELLFSFLESKTLKQVEHSLVLQLIIERYLVEICHAVLQAIKKDSSIITQEADFALQSFDISQKTLIYELIMACGVARMIAEEHPELALNDKKMDQIPINEILRVDERFKKRKKEWKEAFDYAYEAAI